MVASVVLIGCLLLALFVPSNGYFDSFEIDLHPGQVGVYEEMTIEFSLVGDLVFGESVYINLPGYSTGDCRGSAGPSINPGALLLWDPTKWLGSWVDGNPTTALADSVLQLTARQGFASQSTIQVTVDPQNKIRPCTPYEGSTYYLSRGETSGYTAWSDSVDAQYKSRNEAATYGISDQYLGNKPNHQQQIDDMQAITGPVTLYGSSLSWGPVGAAMVKNLESGPRLFTDEGTTMTLKFSSSFALFTTNTIEVAMPGFTASNKAVTRASGSSINPVVLHSSTNYNYDGSAASHPLFTASWNEASYASAANTDTHSRVRPWGEATLSITPTQQLPVYTEFTVIVHHSNGIRTPCPILPDDKGFQLKLSSTGRPSLVSGWTLIDQVQSLGVSCVEDCSGHGNCVLDANCKPRCECEYGFGMNGDDACFHRTCPKGPIFGLPMRRSNRTKDGPATEDGRTLAECSGVGVCDRQTGTCECYPGLSGTACEMQMCLGEDTMSCSGHGRCLSMKSIALADDAMPQTNAERSSLLYSNTAGENYLGEDESEGMGYRPATWDADFIHGCVCDSSWPVGLGDNETQVAEWFGPDCSLRRCPSGDDPMTTGDETDCSGKRQFGTTGAGQAGNKCHVECSNRGTCDHSSGTCTCFDDFTGVNCGTHKYTFEDAEAEVTVSMLGR